MLLFSMLGPFFDVYLTGAVDESPSAQMRLAPIIAERYRLPAPTVAEALAGGRCRVAARLSRQESEDLVQALGALGAVARLWPAGASPAASASVAVETSTLATDRSPPSLPDDGRITLKAEHQAVAPQVVDIADPVDFGTAQPDPGSARGKDVVRCQIHGLAYNRRQASGCVRCLASARVQAQKWREESAGSGHILDESDRPSLAHQPVKRAFWGLAVAVILGFLPAVYYARAVSSVEVSALRSSQAELSRMPASEDVLARFDEIDAATHAAFRRGVGRTLLIWVVGVGVVGVLWTRLTKPGDGDPSS